MTAELSVPQLGEGLREVRIVEILRRAGDAVTRGEPIYVIETDKSTVELESPVDGTIERWTVSPGDVVPVGAVVARFALPDVEGTEKARAAVRPATGEGFETASAVMSAMNGWLPNSIVSDSGSKCFMNSAGPTHQPDRKPGAAWDLEIEAVTTVRSARSGWLSGE